MRVYQRTKFRVSSIILMSFRWGRVIKPPPTSKQNPKKSTKIRVKQYVPSQVLKDFSVENLENIPVFYSQNFISKFLYLELLIIGVVFFIIPDVSSVHLYFFIFFSFFYLYFP